MGLRRIIGKGRAWGNALGGWRAQGRDAHGRWLPKGGGSIRAAGRTARRRYASSNKSAGATRTGAAKSAAHYAAGAMSEARNKGFFVSPSIGLSGGGVEAGYGRKLHPKSKWRATISVKVAVNRTDGGLAQAVRHKAADSLLKDHLAASEFIKKGSYDPGLPDMAVVAQGGQLKVVSGKKARKALQNNKARANAKAKTSKAKNAKRRQSRGTRKSPVQQSVATASRDEARKRAQQLKKANQAKGRYAGGRSVAKTISP